MCIYLITTFDGDVGGDVKRDVKRDVKGVLFLGMLREVVVS
jgi:hypothetical protein